MTTDDDSQALEGEIVGPEGDGQWLPAPEAGPLLKLTQKTLYRRIERNQIPWRKNTLGRFEVWVPNAPAMETRLSPTATTIGIDMADVRELLTPLAKELADSRRESLTATERAIQAEMRLEAAKGRIAELEAEKAALTTTHPVRQSDNLSWWESFKRWVSGDSQ